MKTVVVGFAASIALATIPTYAQDGIVAAGNADAGAIVFKKCRACHTVGIDAKNGVGPALNGIVGRPAGTYPDYGYSAANQNSGLIWDEPTLATYLRAPRKLVPGTKMSFAGLKKDQEIADVISFLRQFDADGRKTAP
jgi:cytochrome c